MHADTFLREVAAIAAQLDRFGIEKMAGELERLRAEAGTLFLVGIGGSAANCSHAAADFRKLCSIKAVALSESVAELSARANDEGFDTAFTGQMWDADSRDALLVLSVGGGTEVVSRPITEAVRLAKDRGMRVLGVVGPDGNVTAQLGDVVVRVPAAGVRVTPHTEAFQMVVVHLLVSHPLLQKGKTKW